ncbi:MAG: phosphoribosylglycinamide formyltransferase [Pseudomonadales bacterium]|nr:phosphoribosylglycinamide formyltransferase [Pseudomonadales bacterium]
MTRLGILASHRGSNFQAILDACHRGELAAETRVAISNNSGSLALERARKEGIPALHISGVTHPDPNAQDLAILTALREYGVELVVTAGYMKKLGPQTLEAFAGRIVNIHPSLLPRHGGHGMFGMNVHRAVIAEGDRETGITIHYVDGDYDTGPVIDQISIPVAIDDTPESLADKLIDLEHDFLVQTLKKIIQT